MNGVDAQQDLNQKLKVADDEINKLIQQMERHDADDVAKVFTATAFRSYAKALVTLEHHKIAADDVINSVPFLLANMCFALIDKTSDNPKQAVKILLHITNSMTDLLNKYVDQEMAPPPPSDEVH